MCVMIAVLHFCLIHPWVMSWVFCVFGVHEICVFLLCLGPLAAYSVLLPRCWSLMSYVDCPISFSQGQGETPEELINSIPPIVVKGRVAACDGGKGALGHPRVYLKLDAPGVPCTCGYCGLRYVQEHH